jgi:glucose-6-phosphate 1-dehydrogenase
MSRECGQGQHYQNLKGDQAMVNSGTAPTSMIFLLYGATGDLARRLVLPAFYRLAIAGLLPEDWRMIAEGRGEVTDEEFQEEVRKALEEFGPRPSEGPWEEVRRRLRFAGGGFRAHDPGTLLGVLAQAKKEMGGRPLLIHYMAVPPSAFGPFTEAIGAHGLAQGSRVVYEKPFGTSLESFRQLDKIAHETFDESQIYRIDHFLGKEATQNIHVLRFANGVFAGAWNSSHIESVQIDVPETLDVAMRADFYDATGAILDMLVTHLFQIAGEIAMEPPHCLEPDCLGEAREAVIGCFRPLNASDVVVGQYDGYRGTDDVPLDSRTETYVAARMWIDNERWAGVPFLLRTGKCLAESRQKVSVVFKDAVPGLPRQPHDGSILGFEMSGDGEIDLRLVIKQPGAQMTLGVGTTALPLGSASSGPPLPAYSVLLNDVLIGDRSLFTRPDGLEHVWTVADGILRNKPEPIPYARGTWGPREAVELARPHAWVS